MSSTRLPRGWRGRCATAWVPGWLFVLALLQPLHAQQDPRPLNPDGTQQGGPWGRTVSEVVVIPAQDRTVVMLRLQTKVGEKLAKANVTKDLVTLYRELKFRATFKYRLKPGGRVAIYVELGSFKHYDRVQFEGLDHLEESEARTLTGLSRSQRVSQDDAELMKLLLLDRYRQDGYYFAAIERVRNDTTRTLTFVIDEGPEVTVHNLRFRGNKSYPGWLPRSFGENLQGSAKLESVPGLISNSPFSVANVEDDITKVEMFYRQRGYLDAQVHLEEWEFTSDHTGVNLTYRIEEGERWQVGDVELVLSRTGDPRDERKPVYTVDEVKKEIGLKKGDFYSTLQIARDKHLLEEFYGRRGHPTRRRFGMVGAASDLFQVGEPQLILHESKPIVNITYHVIEGEAKRLREVHIRGNTTTRDQVIRRNVKLMPGDVLDVTMLDRSRYLLDRTSYFQDEKTLSGVRLVLKSVPGSPQEVDLDIEVAEGRTGSFTWGAGISSGTGVRGNLQFRKQNFDIARLPSSWNPGTWFSEIASGKAFHGGGQTLNLLLAPGNEVSLFSISLSDPDVFDEHIDTVGLRVDAYKRVDVLDTYDTTRVGASIKLSRIFDETRSVSVRLRDEGVRINDISSNAPVIVFDSEGKTEIRAVRGAFVVRDLDNWNHPRAGYSFNTYGEVAGGFIGGEEEFYKIGASFEHYRPIYADALDRKHVLYTKVRFDFADTFGDTKNLFPSERFFMGGSELRGFDQRRAGPSQFDEPVGGTVRLLSTLEYQFPLVSTQVEGTTRHTEIIRGVTFVDFGMLGLDIDDDTFDEPRLTIGFGIRIQVPVLQVPIQLDLAWPLLAEETDREEQLYFSFRRF